MITFSLEREIQFFKSGFVCVTQVAAFTSCFLIVRTLHSANGVLFLQSSLIGTLFHLSLPRHIRSPSPFLPATSKFNALLKTSPLSLLKTCPYHRTPLALAIPPKVFFKPSKLICSQLLLFSIILTPHIALIMAF